MSITFWSRLAVQSFSMVLSDQGALAFIYPCQWGPGEGWLTACECQTVMRVKEARHRQTNPLLELHWKAVKWQRGGTTMRSEVITERRRSGLQQEAAQVKILDFGHLLLIA
ncbi:hypothetical protein [Vibrio mediterranei]|uniref:hypothetical protein n=1 Tax=Vibrio mediterranei TaxID=689 RepID=UPI0040689ABD